MGDDRPRTSKQQIGMPLIAWPNEQSTAFAPQLLPTAVTSV